MSNSNIPQIDVQQIKEQICSVGAQIYDKRFAAANEGNISFRTGENEVLCTPSLHSKGDLTPDDICTVDMTGKQTAGKLKRTSEVLLHLEIYRNRPDVKCVVHCHPPHATAFAVAREPVPVAVLPEPDIFLGEVPIAPYFRPGTQAFAESVTPFVKNTNTIILANHGTVSYDENLERAFWWTDILDAYCKILILARQLGPLQLLSREQSKELLDLRGEWGFSDHRADMGNVDIREFPGFSSLWESAGVAQRAFGPVENELSDATVDRIAQRVVELLERKAEPD
ncbi:MAG: class II aldolase/adducin family protein [Planctomycetota bacterium]